MSDTPTLPTLAAEFLAAWRAVYDVQAAFWAVQRRIIDASIAAGITDRRVYVLGKHAIYVDPPGTGGSAEWLVSLGSPPETVEVQS